jgi:AraC-like DNA-binding protein
MRYLNLKLTNTKLMMTHLDPYSSDPVEHDHGDDYQITIPISGTPNLDLNNKSNHLNKNTRIITVPGEKHIHYTKESESRILLININRSLIDTIIFSCLNQGTSGIDFSIYSEGSSEKLIKVADKVIRTNLFHEDYSTRMEELEWELVETFLTIHEGSHSEKWKKEVIVNQHPIIKNIIGYIYENYQNDISLDELSTVSNLSKFYLIRTFKDIVGCTPNNFVLNIRIEKALDLLLSSNLDITTICYEVGFGSLNTFERVFKKKFGCTISDFRKNCKI